MLRKAVCLALAAAALGAPAAAADPGRIVFVSDRDGNAELYSARPDGAGLRRLTNDPAGDRDPAWSPDGRMIAFSRGDGAERDLYVVSADGSRLRRLTELPGSERFPAWSPDGRSLAFTFTEAGNEDVYVADLTERALRRLTDSPGADTTPVFSPDGGRIAFRSDRDLGDWELYVMAADGSGQTDVSDLPVFADALPDWSPQDRIAFDSNRTGSSEIHAMAPDGSDVTRLTHHMATDIDPTWSPDGSRLAFTSNRDGNDEVYAINADGAGPAPVASSPAADNQPDWGPSPSAGPTVAVLPPPVTSEAIPGPPAPGVVEFAELAVSARRGVVRVPLRCAGDMPCAGRLALRNAAASRRPLGRARVRLDPGAEAIVAVRLARPARRVLARRGRLRVRASVHQHSGTVRATLEIRRA